MPSPGRHIVSDKVPHVVGGLRQPRSGSRQVRLRVDHAAEAIPDDGGDAEGEEGTVRRLHRPRPSGVPQAMLPESK